MKYSKEQYTHWHEEAPIWGFPQENEKCYKAKMVKIRGPKNCAFCQGCDAPDSTKDQYFRFPSGTLMLRETCIYDGTWRSSYTCTYCLDEWIDGLPKR